MSWFVDPEALEADARRLAADAHVVRQRGGMLVRSAAAAAWQGPAADAFRAAVRQDTRDLQRAADELDEAAAALRAHAQAVRARLAELRELADDVSDWFVDRLESLG